MLPSVRPLVRQRTAAGLYGSSRTGSQITAAYSRYSVAHWLSRSRLTDRCAMPSFRSPHALAAPARLRGQRRSPINAPLDQQGPDDAGHLDGQGHGDQHLRLARQHPRQPRARWCAALTGPADHRTRAEDEQTPDGPLAHLRDCAEPLLAAGRFLQGRQPEPGGEVAPGPEALRRGHEGRDRGGRDRTDAWDRHQPARHGVGLRALGDLGIQRLDLRLQGLEGADQHFQDGASAFRYGGVRILDMGDHGIGVRDALGKYVAVLGQMPAQGVDALRALAHQEITGAEHDPIRLLLLAFHRHEAHARALGGFADRLGIRPVVLLPLHVRLDVGRRDQAHGVAQLAELTRPVMRPGAGLHRHRAGRLGGEECEHLRPHQALAEHHTAGRVCPVRLENPLRNIQSDRVSLSHGCLLKWSVDTTTLARRCRQGASIPSRPLEVKNGTLGTLERLEGSSLTVRLDGADRRAVHFELKDYAHVDHGYAATIHKAQGVTVDRTHVLASSFMDRHAAYVGLTRHREGVELHWAREDLRDRAGLKRVLSRERAKDTSLDYQAGFAERRGIDMSKAATPEMVKRQRDSVPAHSVPARLEARLAERQSQSQEG